MSDQAPRPHDAGELRPRPQYGEYATPEEQRSRIQQPDVTEALEAGIAPEAAATPPVMPAAYVTARPGSRVNRLVTIMLLAFGAVNVIFSVVSYLDIVPVVERAMELMGIPGEFTNVAAAQTWGLVAAVLLIVAYLLTTVLTWRVLKAGRISWWIPIVGAIVAYVVVSLCLAVPLMGDPAFVEYISTMR